MPNTLTKQLEISRTPFGKGFWGRLKSYWKAHPIKTILIGSAIVLGAAALIAGCVLTAGALAPVAGGVAAASMAGIFGSVGYSAAGVIAGAITTAIGVGTLGSVTKKHAIKFNKQIGEAALKANINPQSHGIDKKNNPEVVKDLNTVIQINDFVLLSSIRKKFADIKIQLASSTSFAKLKDLENGAITHFKQMYATAIVSYDQAEKAGTASEQDKYYISEYNKLVIELDHLLANRKTNLAPKTLSEPLLFEVDAAEPLFKLIEVLPDATAEKDFVPPSLESMEFEAAEPNAGVSTNESTTDMAKQQAQLKQHIGKSFTDTYAEILQQEQSGKLLPGWTKIVDKEHDMTIWTLTEDKSKNRVGTNGQLVVKIFGSKAYDYIKTNDLRDRGLLIFSAVDEYIKANFSNVDSSELEKLHQYIKFKKLEFNQAIDTNCMIDANRMRSTDKESYFDPISKNVLQILKQLNTDLANSLQKFSKQNNNSTTFQKVVSQLKILEKQYIEKNGRPNIIKIGNIAANSDSMMISAELTQGLQTIPSSIRNKRGLCNHVLECIGRLQKNNSIEILYQGDRHSSYPPIMNGDELERRYIAYLNVKEKIAATVSNILSVNSNNALLGTTLDNPIKIQLSSMMLLTPIIEKRLEHVVRGKMSEHGQVNDSRWALEMLKYQKQPMQIEVQGKIVYVYVESSYMNLPVNSGKYMQQIVTNKLQNNINKQGFCEYWQQITAYLHHHAPDKNSLKALSTDQQIILEQILEQQNVLSIAYSKNQNIINATQALNKSIEFYSQPLQQAYMELNDCLEKYTAAKTNGDINQLATLSVAYKKIKNRIRDMRHALYEAYQSLNKARNAVFDSMQMINKNLQKNIDLLLASIPITNQSYHQKQIREYYLLQQRFLKVQQMFFAKAYQKAANAYEIQSLYLLTNQTIGREVEGFCKSAEDRTGWLHVNLLALTAFYSEYGRDPDLKNPVDADIFQKHFAFKAHELSASLDNTQFNSAARGLQIGAAFTNKQIGAKIGKATAHLAKDIFTQLNYLQPQDHYLTQFNSLEKQQSELALTAAEQFLVHLQTAQSILAMLAKHYLLGVKVNLSTSINHLLKVFDAPTNVSSVIDNQKPELQQFYSTITKIKTFIVDKNALTDETEEQIHAIKKKLQLLQKFDNPDVQAFLLANNLLYSFNNSFALTPQITEIIIKLNQPRTFSGEQSSNIALLQQYLREIGINIHNETQLENLLKIIVKPYFVEKVINNKLREIIISNPQVHLTDHDVEKLNNLAAKSLSYGEFYTQFRQIVQHPIDFSSQAFASIAVERKAEIFKGLIDNLPINYFEVTCNKFLSEFPIIFNSMMELDKQRRINIFAIFNNVIKKLFGINNTLTIADLPKMLSTVNLYRNNLKSILEFFEIAKSFDYNALKVLFGLKAEKYIAFIEKYAVKITEHQPKLHSELDVLLNNNFHYFLEQFDKEIIEIEKANMSLIVDEKHSLSKLDKLKQQLRDNKIILDSKLVIVNNLVSTLQTSSEIKLATQTNMLEHSRQKILDLVKIVKDKESAVEKLMQYSEKNQLNEFAINRIKVRDKNTLTTINSNKSTNIQLNSDRSKVIMPVNANGLFYQMAADGSGKYHRPKNYVESLPKEQKLAVSKCGYSKDEKKIVEHMVINCVAEFLKIGENRFSITGATQLCHKAARNILTLMPKASVYVNGSTTPYKLSLSGLFEVKRKRELYEKLGLTDKEILASKLNGTDIIEVPANKFKPGSAT